MFEKSTRLHVKSLLESEFVNFTELEKTLKVDHYPGRQQSYARSANEYKMTRKHRSRNRRFTTSIFQSGYCAGCHIPYINLEEHIHTKRHLKLIGDDFISIRSFDSFLELEDLEPRSKMPRTREKSAYDRVKDLPMSPAESESGHRLRSRKNVNYMTPLSEDDSLLEEPVVENKEYRELRSSSRLLAKLNESPLESDTVWNSGRPKRLCNRRRLYTDSRLKKIYSKVEILPSKLRSGVLPFNSFAKLPETPTHKHKDYNSLAKLKKTRCTELSQLNTEAENFLFPKKDDTTDEEDEEETEDEKYVNKKTRRNYSSSVTDTEESKQSVDDEESMHSTNSSNKIKKKRRTHAEAFIMDNQKYYKFETPGTRLRYQGSYLSPVPSKPKNNGDILTRIPEKGTPKKIGLNLNEFKFSFESVPKNEAWFEAFQRRDLGNEKYVFTDTNLWNSLILPYELDYVPPLDPRKCLSQYNQIKKCLIEPTSASTSVTCSTPDPATSSSSFDNQDEDSKISNLTEVSSTSTCEEIPILTNKRGPPSVSPPKKSKNSRKSPRQHASTLAILSSLIQQRKRKLFRGTLPSILEESSTPVKKKKKNKVDYLGIWKKVQEELSVNEEEIDWEFNVCDGDDIDFRRTIVIEELFDDASSGNERNQQSEKKATNGAKPGRKPGRRKKNMTGWPRNRKYKKESVTKEDMNSVNVNSKTCKINRINPTDNRSVKKQLGCVKKSCNSENNNKQHDQSSLSDRDRVKSDQTNDKILTNKVNNSDGFNSFDLQYQPIVRVQKLDKKHIFVDNNKVGTRRSNSPKRTNRGQRRMPASPKSPRMLRRPRGRWYRER